MIKQTNKYTSYLSSALNEDNKQTAPADKTEDQRGSIRDKSAVQRGILSAENKNWNSCGRV